MIDIEKTLSQELHQVVDGLHVPALPALPQEPPRATRHWMPVLAAAAVLLVVLGVVAVVSIDRGSQDPDPAPPTPTPSETKSTEPPVETPTTAPTIPYTVEDRLYVNGEQTPGTWWYLESGGGAWLAMRADDNTWWWGRGPEPRRVEGASLDRVPMISPNGSFVAVVDDAALLTGTDTRDGSTVGSVSIDVEPGLRVRAVTNDGNVVVQGAQTAVLWDLADGEFVDITTPAPGEQILANTPAGLLVGSADESERYLGEISETGELTRIADLPPNDSLVVGPDAEWMAWTPPGTLGGEVTAVDSLEASSVDGGQRATFTAPDGWGFQVQDWAWETDDYLVSPVLPNSGEGAARMARCSVLDGDCVLIR